MKYTFVTLILITSPQLSYCSAEQKPEICNPQIADEKIPLTKKITVLASSFYKKIWGTSPDIALTDDEKLVPRDEYEREAHYTRNVVLHCLRIGQVQENTTRRSNTLSILAGIFGTGIAHRIVKGFHGDLSALAIASSGLATWACARALGKWVINRGKRTVLEERTQDLLKNTPDGHLYYCFLDPKQSVTFNTLSDICISQRIMEHVDEQTITRMYSYWLGHKKPSSEYPLQASRIRVIAES